MSQSREVYKGVFIAALKYDGWLWVRDDTLTQNTNISSTLLTFTWRAYTCKNRHDFTPVFSRTISTTMRKISESMLRSNDALPTKIEMKIQMKIHICMKYVFETHNSPTMLSIYWKELPRRPWVAHSTVVAISRIHASPIPFRFLRSTVFWTGVAKAGEEFFFSPSFYACYSGRSNACRGTSLPSSNGRTKARMYGGTHGVGGE